MPDLMPFRDLAIALALGLLIGLERGWSAREEPAGHRVAGFRTFGIVGLVGGLAGLLAAGISKAAAVILLVATAAALVAGYIRDMKRGDSVSATSTIAAFATLGTGMLATSGQPLLAASAAVVMVLLLSMREELHAWIRGLSAVEVKSVARFALIAIVIWPLLPNEYYGPFDAWNPRQIWFVVVLISGLSFVGYIAAKRVGEARGMMATAVTGALVSSTAVTATLAHRLKEGDAPAPLIAGIAAASAVMIARSIVLAAILAMFAVPSFALVVVPMGLISLAYTVSELRRDHAQDARATKTPRNPFDLFPAFGFAALIAGAALFARWALDAFGDHGLAVVLAITGSFDVDAATVTLGSLPKGSIDPRTAGLVLSVPVIANTLWKGVITVGIAGWKLGRAGASSLFASALAGIVVLGFAVLV